MSYISSLNLLGDESSIPISEEDVTDELALWANAQFKFDSAPGSALLDDPLKPSTTNNCIYGVLNNFNNFDHQQHSLITHSTNNPIEHHQHPSLMTMMTPDLYTATTTSTTSPDLYAASTTSTTSPDLYAASTTSTTTPLTTPTFDMHSTDSIFTTNETTMDDTTIQSSPSSPQDDDATETSTVTGPVPKTKTGMDEDKRRRNTAASARFRQKKKLREQALQQTVQEMTEKAEVLEKRCQELEMEAKWLRALLVEKNPALVTPLSSLKMK